MAIEVRTENYRVTRYPCDCVSTIRKQCCLVAKEMWVISVRVSAVATVSWSDALCGEDVLWGVSRSRCWQASCFSVLYTATTWPWIIEAKSIATISTLIPAKGRQRKSSCEGNGLHSVWHDLRIRIWGKCKWWCSYCRLWRSLCLCDLPPGTCWGRGREHCSTVKGWQEKTWHQLTAHERSETQ